MISKMNIHISHFRVRYFYPYYQGNEDFNEKTTFKFSIFPTKNSKRNISFAFFLYICIIILLWRHNAKYGSSPRLLRWCFKDDIDAFVT